MEDRTRLHGWTRLWMKAFLFAVAIHRRITLGSRVALIEGDRVLLIRHTYVPGWQFPGGGVEPGETAERSAAREAREETGHEPVGPMQFFGFYHNINPATNRDHIAFYVCHNFVPAFEFKPNHEIAEARWFSIRDLPADVTPATIRRLAEIFDGTATSPNW